ncbi:hypothetical protein PSEUDO9AZ_12082 [Pseudomonas sp. 9AZ]|nr:hypothetical protein PSEUDO9AZ_12082 [Pseudomonas sp. 9AZ]
MSCAAKQWVLRQLFIQALGGLVLDVAAESPTLPAQVAAQLRTT